RLDTCENVTHGRAAKQRLSADEPDVRLGEFFELGVGKIVLRLVVTPSLRCHLRIGNLSRRRNLVGAIYRTFALEEIEVNGVRKVLDLLWLPDPEALPIVPDVEPAARRS